MCSPGKAPPAKKDTEAKFASPSKTKTQTTKTRKLPKSISKARGGLPSNVNDLTIEEALVVANLLKDLPDGHPDRDSRTKISSLPGKPRISLKPWAYDANPPFLLAVRSTGCHYIPLGEKADAFLLKLMINEIQQKKHKVTDPGLIYQIFAGLNGYSIQGAFQRVKNIFKNATLLQYLGGFTQKDDVRTLVNQLHARFLQSDADIQAPDAKIDATIDATIDAKVDKLNAKIDAASATTLLELRPTGVNQKLRLDPHDAWARNRADCINKYLETLPVHSGMCYRGINAKGMSPSLVLGWNSPNSEYTDEAFTTASLSKDIAWTYAEQTLTIGWCW